MTSARSRWIAVAVITATFVAGMMVGYAVPRLMGQEAEQRPATAQRTDRERRGERHSIFDELNLTPQQQAQRDSILEQGRAKMDAFWKEHGPAMRTVADSTRAQIDRILTPEQRARVQEWREQRRKQREEWERKNGRAPGDRTEGRGGPPGPPPGALHNPEGFKDRLYL